MATSSQRPISRRPDSYRQDSYHHRMGSKIIARTITLNDAYLYSLRVAYLAHLLQPRARRTQFVPSHQKTASVQWGSSLQEWVGDIGRMTSKSTKLPRGFMNELTKRMESVMVGTEKKAEFQDASVKRTFAASLNTFIEPGFKKRQESDRKVEDIVLLFFSNATKILQTGKSPGDDSFKMMAERHVALFVRLLSMVLEDNNWTKERPELATKLKTLELQLLSQGQQLDTTINGSTTEVETPVSHDVKDMPMVQHVCKIFQLSNTVAQSDIDRHKGLWTEQNALNDLKRYQKLLNLASRRTLRSEDFDLEESYELWKKGEAPELSQMLLAIVKARPELAKMTSVHNDTAFSLVPLPTESPADISNGFDDGEQHPYIFQQPVDMSAFTSAAEEISADIKDEDDPFVFMPPDPRGYFRQIISQIVKVELVAEQEDHDGKSDASDKVNPISKKSIELLDEICMRWRLPLISRCLLCMDVAKTEFVESTLSLAALNDLFEFVKEHKLTLNRKEEINRIWAERERWTLQDFALNRKLILILHQALQRDVYSILMQCYTSKPPTPGPTLQFLDEHVFADPTFSVSQEEVEDFKTSLRNGLAERAREAYQEIVKSTFLMSSDDIEFNDVLKFGKEVSNLSSKIKKRYSKNPEVMGARPWTILVETILPSYARDAQRYVSRAMEVAEERELLIPIEDGFVLYKELVTMRRAFFEALPAASSFPFHIENTLEPFVWRWIRSVEDNVVSWAEGAVREDNFAVRVQKAGDVPTEEQRHSSSVLDLFSSLSQTIEKILDLDWDNDLQYAKFMTALSKVVGVGMATYADLIEKRFEREMDRLTPEQEAAAVRSRQEKWMQMAKDAWSQKERVEPFKFYPESLVKLNNIEYAVQQLDKIEREINVDACVEVIQQNTPPVPSRQRRAQTYVFTVKIVEAEDLLPCDINGLSDPYVVLGDEFQKRLSKTRIIHSNLNPRWDESVDIVTSGPLNIVATVWDWDAVGDHDCMGRTSVKLDPNHFGDFVPREYWLDLDTQGRLLLRISMEGERDDIQFYFGKAFRTLRRTERDMTRTITDKLSAYINHNLSRRALKSLLNRGISGQLASVTNYFNRNRNSGSPTGPPQADPTEAIQPLLAYFDDNFAIMNQTLTSAAMIMVMSRLWKEVLMTLEGLMIPPLSYKGSNQKPLDQKELDVVYSWLQTLFDFFHAVDEETGQANGVPLEVLRSPKYIDLKSLSFFYNQSTDELIRLSERMATANMAKDQALHANRMSAPPGSLGMAMPGPGSFRITSGMLGRPKSVMLSRNLGTIRKVKEEKRKEAQAEANDDMILRILRMRVEAEKYLRDRGRQKERLAARAAAERIVQASIAQSAASAKAASYNLVRR